MMHGSFVNGGGPISISELIKSKRNRKPWVSCFSFSFYTPYTFLYLFSPCIHIHRYPVAIAFDIDGVLMRGGQPIHGAQEALRKLFKRKDNPSKLSYAFIFKLYCKNIFKSKTKCIISNENITDVNYSLCYIEVPPVQIKINFQGKYSLSKLFGFLHLNFYLHKAIYLCTFIESWFKSKWDWIVF